MHGSFPQSPIEEFAEGYLRAAHLLEVLHYGKNDVRIGSATAVSIVPLYSLGVEVALKASQRRFLGTAGRGHDLVALWESLPVEERAAIRQFEELELRDGPFIKYPWGKDFADVLRFPDPSVVDLLGERSAFEIFRYRYEHEEIIGIPIRELGRIGYALIRYLGAEPWPDDITMLSSLGWT